MPFKVDVDEWRLRYPGEDIEGEHDILDFGFWYYAVADGNENAATNRTRYEPPCENWRLEREAMIKEEKEL